MAAGRRVPPGLRGAALDTGRGERPRPLVPTEELRPWFGSDGKAPWTGHEERLLVSSLASDCEKLLGLPILQGEAEGTGRDCPPRWSGGATPSAARSG